MKKQRIYISGPMTSSDSEEQARNVQAFHDCATLLRASGCRPVNPARCWACRFKWLYKAMERMLGKDGAYRTVLVYDLWLLSRSDTICMIDGWQQSRVRRLRRALPSAWASCVRTPTTRSSRSSCPFFQARRSVN